MEETVYLNGSLIPRNQAKVSILDYGFLFGYALFETMRAYNDRVFRLASHLNRLAISAERLGIPVEIDLLERAVLDTLRANGLSEARIRLIVSIGEGNLTPDTRTCIKPMVVVVAGRYIPYSQEAYEKGFRAILSNIHRNSQSPVSGLKSANFLESMLAKQEARIAGADEAFLLNDRGLLAEASSSNLFIGSKGVLRTPKLGSGILPGVTRAVVLELAAKLGIKAIERDISQAELMKAGEVFLTNSLIEIMPVTEIASKPVGSGKPGEIAKRMMAAYRELVAKQTR